MNKINRKKTGLLCIYGIITALVVIIDQITKLIVAGTMTLNETKKFIPPLLNFTYHRNLGAAWGIFSDKRWIFIILSTAAIFIIPYFIYKYYKIPLFAISLSLITGGGIGNLIDRFFYSDGVIDFLEFGFFEFPVFNIADSCICIGAALMVIYLIFFDKTVIRDDKNKKKSEKSDVSENITDENDKNNR